MPEVLEISSDEEEGLKEETKSSDLDWIQELLFNSDDESDADSDVVIIHENKPPELKSKSSKDADDDDDDDDDDDCVVLEGDPENGVTSVDEEDSTGSDELVVVGEKGQVACRDYPHARHLCAKFPFSSTPHEMHCGQCHCFVCDSLAPCIKWGTGISSSDHCHAHDKTEVWKLQRKDFKRSLSSPLPAPTNYGTSLLRSQSNENLPCDITHLSPISVLRNQAVRSSAMHTPSLNCIPQNLGSRPKATYAHFSLSSGMQNQISRPINVPVSKATNPTIPNGANRGRYLESRSNLARDRNRSHYAPKQLLGVRNHAIQRERGRGASSLGPQILRSPMLSKELAGCTGYILGANHPFRNSPTFKNHVNSVQIHSATGLSKPLNVSILSHSSSAPVSPSCVNPHTVTSETQYGQALSQSNHSQNFHQTCMQGNNAPYAASLNSNQHGNELQNVNANGNITQIGITNQDTYQPKPQEESQNITAGRFSAFDPSWAENTSQLNALFEHSPLQSTGSTDQPPNVEKFSTQFIESVEPASESSHIPSTIVDFDNWLSGKETGPMATDGVLPFENIPSPDPSLFDVDTSELSSLWW
ncbi:GATA zinc finger domain-containing protein [Trifolium repens]|nr:GATA zinc finger domain-containing protein [Trifolium repens]